MGIDKKKRGFAAQRHRRTAERVVRIASLVFSRWAGQRGVTREDRAAHLRISLWTLARWQHRWRQDRLAPRERGRPSRRLSRSERQLVIEAIKKEGPGTGLRILKGLFPQAARRELASLLARYRRVYLHRHARLVHVLHWERPGAVWAMDFTRPPRPVDGIYSELLLVRDTSSGYEPLYLPASSANCEVTSGALVGLFQEHGPPLVMKSDNGSAFKGALAQGTLLDWKVFSLLSPQATPQYNGSVEAGIGKLKVRAHWEAERNGRAGLWTSDDIEAARLISNQTPRRAGQSYVTPQSLWESRSPITDQERSEFARTVELCRPQALRHYDLSPDAELTSKQKDAVDRFAVSRALVALGYLSFTRRRITPPFKSVFRAKIR